MTDFVARTTAKGMMLRTLGALVFVGLGVLMLHASAWLGGLLIVLFGLLAIVNLKATMNPGVSLEISSLGILSRRWSDDLIPWSEVEAVHIWRHRGDHRIVLRLRDPDRFPTSRELGRSAAFANRALTGGDVPISLGGTDRTVAEAMAAVTRWIPDKVQG